LITLGSILRMKFEAHVKTTILGQTFVSVEGCGLGGQLRDGFGGGRADFGRE
jgi:hypothetical protein